MDAVEAGRKGGRSRSPRKLAAAKRNGFQPHPYDPERVKRAIQTGDFTGLRADEALDAATGRKISPGAFLATENQEPADATAPAK